MTNCHTDMKPSSKRRRGFSLITLAILLPVVIAGTGLSVDLGRVYVTKTELQQFADSAAVAAAFELDGTTAGISDAYTKAQVGPGTSSTRNRWNFDTSSVSVTSVQFSQQPAGPWTASPASAANYRFIRVVASANIPIYFLRVLPGAGSEKTVDATAIAGQGLENQLGPGMAPFSPDAQDRNDPNFGYTVGEEYTLKWAPPGQRAKNNRCHGDRNFLPGGGDSDRGYINVGQGDGQSGLYDAIVNGGYYLSNPLVIGSAIDHVQGNKHVGPAIKMRYNQDTDPESMSLGSYSGNGRRMMAVPVNNGMDNSLVVGFALFLLTEDSCAESNVKPCCGIYLSNNPVLYSDKPGAGGSGLYRVKLYF